MAMENRGWVDENGKTTWLPNDGAVSGTLKIVIMKSRIIIGRI